MPNRILVYTHGLVGGGAERVLATLASGLRMRGHDVQFAVDFEASESRHLLDPQIPLTVLGGNHVASIRSLRRLLREQSFDIAISAVGGSNVKLLAALSLAQTKTRAIISYHGFEEFRTGRLGALSYRLLPWMSRKASRTIAVSDALRDELVARWGSVPEKTVRIYNPVVLPADEHCARDAETLRARAPIALAVGRLVPDKDFLTLVRAFARVQTPDARLMIVGEGSDRGALKAEIDKLGLVRRVTLTGHQPDPGPLYATAKCFISSSRTESFGNAVVEALYCGLPVVATNCAGPAEILGGGRWGTLVAVADVEAMARSIEVALSEPGDPRPRTERASLFRVEAGIDAYEALLADVMSRA